MAVVFFSSMVKLSSAVGMTRYYFNIWPGFRGARTDGQRGRDASCHGSYENGGKEDFCFCRWFLLRLQ